MLKDNPRSLNCYKQPAAGIIKGGQAMTGPMPKESNKIDDLVSRLMQFTKSNQSGSSTYLQTVESSFSPQSPSSLPSNRLQVLSQSLESDSSTFSLARVLVWLMAPVAAEYLRYGMH